MREFLKWLKDTETEEAEPTFEKTYRAIRNLFEELFGEKMWEALPVPSSAKKSKAKAKPLPFGSEMKLTPEERTRYTLAKKILAEVAGMPSEGWGLYGRSIKGRLKKLLEDDESRKKLLEEVERWKKKIAETVK